MFVRCLCCGPCAVLLDVVSSNNLALFDQVAGSWAYTSGSFGTANYGTASDDAILIHTVEPSPASKILRSSAEVRMAAYGDETHYYFGWLDASNHIVGRLTFEEDCRLFEVFSVVAGVETKIGDIDCAALKLPTGTDYLEVRFDWDGTYLRAVLFYGGSFDAELRTCEASWATTEPPGMRVGVGTGDITGTFKLIRLEVTRYSSDCLTVAPLTCFLTHDRFTRPDALDPGCRWEVRGAAAYEIDTNKLVPTAAGECIHVREFPAGSHKIRGTVTAGAGGGESRLIVAWTGDDDYLFGKIEEPGTGSVRSSVWAREAGVERQLSPSVRVGTGTGFILSYDGVRAMLSGNGINQAGYAPGWTGTRVGFGAPTIVAGSSFDNFQAEGPLVVGSSEGSNCQAVQVGECSGVVLSSSCNDYGPGRITALLPGLLNGSCSDCADFSQTVLLTGGLNPIQGFGVNYGFLGACIWGYRANFSQCTYDRLEAYVGFAKWSGVTYLTGFMMAYLSSGAAASMSYFRASSAAPYDCLNFAGLSLAHYNGLPDDWGPSGPHSGSPSYCKTSSFPFADGPMEIWSEP